MGERRPRATVAVALLLAAGCANDGSRDRRGGDPLLGSGGPPAGSQPVAVATATGVSPPPPAYKPQPPLTAATPTSNAALAGGFQPLTGGTDLRIGNGPSTGGGVQLQQPSFTDPRAGTPATPTGFSPVTAVPPPGVAVPPAANAIGSPMAGPGGPLDQAYAAVAAQNPLGHDMKFNSQTGEYTFHLIVPSKLNTSAARHVEASAQSPADAIRRALEQLNN